MEAVIQGCRLYYRYEKSDDASAPTVLLLHGWGCDGSIFASFEKELSRHASLLIVDFPGHGKSGEPAEPWGVPEYAEQIFALLQTLRIPKAHIIAHSFGGRVAIYLASHHPERVERMVLTGAAGLRAPASDRQSRRQKRYQRLKKLALLATRLPFLKKYADRWMEKLIQKYGSEDYRRLNANMRKTFVKVIQQDLSEMLPLIQSSTLLIWGSQDTATPLWMGQKMEKEIPDAGLVVFEGRTHFAFLEEAQRFQTIVNTFLWGGNEA